MDRSIIERYAAGAPAPAKAIEGMTREQLLATPVPGKWSTQQVIIHLMDSDLVGAERMKRVIATERPLLLGYDETAFAKSLFYDKLDAALACEVFAKNRELVAVILRALPDEAFKRTGVHSERGLETLEELVVGYAEHLEHHLKFIEEKRRALRS
jgi:hypothetical protein